MVINERDRERCKLNIGDTKFKRVQKSHYMGSVITDDGKYDAEIERHRVIAKDIFQKLSNVLRVQNIILVMKKGC